MMLQTLTSVLMAACCVVGYGAYLLMAECNQDKIALDRKLEQIKARQATYDTIYAPAWNEPSGSYRWTQA